MHVLGGRQEQVARQLLGDGRAAPQRAVGMHQVVAARADDAPGVEAEVMVELPVLDGHEGAGHIGRQRIQIDRGGVLAASDRDQRAGAIQVGDRGLALDQVELGGVGQAMGQHRDGRDDQYGRPDAADRPPIEDRLRQGARRAAAGPTRTKEAEASGAPPLIGGAAGSCVGHDLSRLPPAAPGVFT